MENFVKSSQIISTLLLHGDFFTFSTACLAASFSISMPVIWAVLRCAAISDIKPVPAPTSSILLQEFVSNQAPSRQPSVPTFIAHNSCSMVNCLNLK